MVPFLLPPSSEISSRISETWWCSSWNKWSTGTFSFIFEMLGCDSNFLIANSTGLFRLKVSLRVKPFGFMYKALTAFTKKELNPWAAL